MVILGGGALLYAMQEGRATADQILSVARQLDPTLVKVGDPANDDPPELPDLPGPNYGHGFRGVQRSPQAAVRFQGDILSPPGHPPRVFAASMVLTGDLFARATSMPDVVI
jgi:hypothetical protein